MMASPYALEMRQWLAVDETGGTMLRRMARRRMPAITPMPPLHKEILHGGHVLEIAGPSGSGKSELLLQAVVSCILPKEWDGFHIGGSERAALYFDLDSRFDIRRLVTLLKWRVFDAINGLSGFANAPPWQPGLGQDYRGTAATIAGIPYVSFSRSPILAKLLGSCLSRFYHKRCSNSFLFLASLKTSPPVLGFLGRMHGGSPQLLVVDSIAAFYWRERSTRAGKSELGWKTLGLQNVSRAIVTELQVLRELFPKLLIMASKTMILKTWAKTSFKPIRWRPGWMKTSTNHRQGFRTLPLNVVKEDEPASTRNAQKGPTQVEKSSHRDFVPAWWREFVSHRILLNGPYLSGLDQATKYSSIPFPYFTAQWDKPFSTHVDRFRIHPKGIQLSK